MTDDKLLPPVLAAVAKVAKRDVAEIALDQRIAEDLGVKSVGRIELAALLETQIGVQIGNFEIRRPKTVKDVLGLVQSKL